jgi:uncharacterized protein YjiS (DUF1127 family)
MTARPVRRRTSAAFMLRAAQTGGAALMQIARAMTDRLEMRRQTEILASLDDHTLKDIGITRGEIPFLVRAARR